MQIDVFVDPGCCETTVCCCSLCGSWSGIIGKIMMKAYASKLGRFLLIISKLCGIFFDILAMHSVTNSGGLLAWMIIYFIIDRVGALIMMCVYGVKPKEFVQGYAETLEMANKIPDKEGIYSLYFASLFSVVDFMGQVWKSYTYAMDITDKDLQISKAVKRAESVKKQEKETGTEVIQRGNLKINVVSSSSANDNNASNLPPKTKVVNKSRSQTVENVVSSPQVVYQYSPHVQQPVSVAINKPRSVTAGSIVYASPSMTPQMAVANGYQQRVIYQTPQMQSVPTQIVYRSAQPTTTTTQYAAPVSNMSDNEGEPEGYAGHALPQTQIVYLQSSMSSHAQQPTQIVYRQAMMPAQPSMNAPMQPQIRIVTPPNTVVTPQQHTPIMYLQSSANSNGLPLQVTAPYNTMPSTSFQSTNSFQNMTPTPTTPRTPRTPQQIPLQIVGSNNLKLTDEPTSPTQESGVMDDIENVMVHYEAGKKHTVTGASHATSIFWFGCMYFMVIFVLTICLWAITAFIDADLSPLMSFVLWCVQTANAMGLLQHYYLLGTRTNMKCRGNGSNCCSRCLGQCFCCWMMTLGVFALIWTQLYLIGYLLD